MKKEIYINGFDVTMTQDFCALQFFTVFVYSLIKTAVYVSLCFKHK